jgi:hypothetical protein
VDVILPPPYVAVRLARNEMVVRFGLENPNTELSSFDAAMRIVRGEPVKVVVSSSLGN